MMWPDAVDEVLAGDQVVGLGYVTPASGVVLTPVTNFGLRDRSAGRLTAINSSVGVYKKLERLRANPKVAVAYHTRRFSFSDRPDYVLVQGTASLAEPDPDYPRSIRAAWERFGGPVEVGRAWDWWLRVYNMRVAITIDVHRIVIWPDLRCEGVPQVYGEPLGGDPAPQRPPAKGTGPRLNHVRAAERAAQLPDTLLGWVDADGFPTVLPVELAGTEQRGIVLDPPPGLVPPGGRRAGLISHWFARYTAGQNQRKHTGWLEAQPGERRVIYAPHTEKGYRMPASMFVYRLAAGAATRRGYRGARRAGIAPALPTAVR
jgi:hypothetical protein